MYLFILCIWFLINCSCSKQQKSKQIQSIEYISCFLAGNFFGNNSTDQNKLSFCLQSFFLNSHLPMWLRHFIGIRKILYRPSELELIEFDNAYSSQFSLIGEELQHWLVFLKCSNIVVNSVLGYAVIPIMRHFIWYVVIIFGILSSKRFVKKNPFGYLLMTLSMNYVHPQISTSKNYVSNHCSFH